MQHLNFQSKRLIHEGFNTVSIEKWHNYVEHVRAVETPVSKADENQNHKSHSSFN
jgi:hypothetical protein